MKIILNNNKSLRTVDFNSQSYYNLSDVDFYIPISFEIKDLLCFLGSFTSFPFVVKDQYKNYNVCKLDIPVIFTLGEGKYLLDIRSPHKWSSDSLEIQLKEVEGYSYQKEIDKKTGIEAVAETLFDTSQPTPIVIDNKIIPDTSVEKLKAKIIIQGDINSSIIKFQMNRHYDNKDLYNAEQIFVFIRTPGMMKDGVEQNQYYRQPLQIGTDVKLSEDGETMYCIWKLGEIVAKEIAEGTEQVLFALGFASADEHYVHQTEIGQLTVRQGLALENASEDSSVMQEDMIAWLANHKEFIIGGLIDEHPIIEVNDRVIEIDANQNILIEGDTNSQLITFRMDRFHDGIDLLEQDKAITIKYINAKGESFRAKTVAKKEDTSDISKMTFGWIVTNNLTREQGLVKFAIEAMGYHADTKEAYVWQTFPATLKVEEGLGGGFGDDGYAPEDLKDLTARIELLEQKVEGSMQWGEIGGIS